MREEKGFTLIELLAVIVILGIIMMIAIPSVSGYVTSSRKSSYIKLVQNYANGLNQYGSSGGFHFYDINAVYYVPINCIELESGGESIFGKFKEAYVVVLFNGFDYNYYWYAYDSANMGVNLVNVKDITEKDIRENMDSLTIRTLNSKRTINVVNSGTCDFNTFDTSNSISPTDEKFFAMDPDNLGVITKYTGTDTNIVIPESINGVPVTSISANAFANKGITSLILPDTLKDIGSQAFFNNNIAGDIIIPDSVETIGTNAFRNDSSTDNVIETVIIGENVKSVDRTAFHDKVIKNIIIKGNTAIKYAAFKRSEVEHLDLGGATVIEYQAFAGNHLQGDIKIPSTVTSIGQDAFRTDVEGVSNVGTLTIPESVTFIDKTAFHGLNINTLKIEGNPTLSYAVFKKCNIKNLSLGKITSITDGEVFMNCDLTSVTIPNTMTKLASSTFSGNLNLKDVKIDNTVGSLANAPWGTSGATITYLR